MWRISARGSWRTGDSWRVAAGRWHCVRGRDDYRPDPKRYDTGEPSTTEGSLVFSERADCLPLAELIEQECARQCLSLNDVARLVTRAAEQEGERADTGKQTIHRWRRGQIPRPDHLRWLAAGLGLPLEQVVAAAGLQRERLAALVEAADMNRREALKRGAAALVVGGAALAAFIRDTAVESSQMALEADEPTLEPATLEALHGKVQRFGLNYLHTPPRQLYIDVHTTRCGVRDLLGRGPNHQERTELFALAGWLSGLLGHLAMDLGHQAAAQAHCEGGVRFAERIGQHNLIAWIRGTQAMVATYTGRAAEGVCYAQMGQQVAAPGSSAKARLAAQEMRAHAKQGNGAGAEDAMRRAEEAMAALTEEPTGSIFSFDRPYLPFYSGTSYVWLGDSANARKRSEEAIALCDAEPDDWPVARGLARIDLATALAWQREPDEACRVGAEAAEISSKRRIDLVVRRSGDLRRALAPYSARPAVRDLTDQLATLI